ncbi:MAG: preprotein translocase subunit SecE [Clostridia bacterium]|nr:preprotein translocase subunit SecE [Clostridia bacterium]
MSKNKKNIEDKTEEVVLEDRDAEVNVDSTPVEEAVVEEQAVVDKKEKNKQNKNNDNNAENLKKKSNDNKKDKNGKKKKQNKNKVSITQSVRGTMSELKKVTWPTFKEVVKRTGVVLVFVLVFGVLIFGIDSLLGFLVKLLQG